MRAAAILLLLPLPALAAQTFEGDQVQVSQGDAGLWNDHDSEVGLGFRLDPADDFCEFVYPGSPWAHLSVSYTQAEASYGYEINSDYSLGGGGGAATLVADTLTTMEAPSEEDLSDGTTYTSRHVYAAGDVQITKVEQFDSAGTSISLQLLVENTGTDDVSDLLVYFEADMDQDETGCTPDSEEYLDYATLNDVMDLDADGTDDFVQSVGPASGWTAGFLACQPADATLGHNEDWSSEYSPDEVELLDEDGEENDDAQGVITSVGDLAAGTQEVVGIVVVLGETDAEAQATATAEAGSCDICDDDADGAFDELCGGWDCDDEDAGAYPSAEETVADGIDQDCDGTETCYVDADLDGYGDPATTTTSETLDCSEDGVSANADDCDDADDGSYLGAEEIAYDGIDQDCDGFDLCDVDEDGFDAPECGGVDCNDEDAEINPEAEEIWYDTVDQDCDGNDDDQDGDGVRAKDDCDDEDPTVSAPEDCEPDDGGDEGGDDGSTDDTDGDDVDGDDDEDSKGSCSVVPAADAGLWGLAALGMMLMGRRRRES